MKTKSKIMTTVTLVAVGGFVARKRMRRTCMNKRLTALLLGACILLVAATAQAVTVTYVDTQTVGVGSVGYPPYPQGFNIPKFAPSLGTLNSVTVTVSGSTTTTLEFFTPQTGAGVAARGESDNLWVLSYYYDADDNLKGNYTPNYTYYPAGYDDDGNPIQILLPNPIATRSVTQALSVTWQTDGYYPTDSGGGPANYIYPITVLVSDDPYYHLGEPVLFYTQSWGPFGLPTTNAVYTSPADLADFTGTGIAPLGVAFDGWNEMGGNGGDWMGWADTEGNFTASVTYDYTSVPEPATICLLGLGALSLLRRKR